MATAEELKAQIAEMKRRWDVSALQYQQLDVEKAAALERQRLRNELQAAKYALDMQDRWNSCKRAEIANVNADRDCTVVGAGSKKVMPKYPEFVSGNEATSCSSGVVRGEFIWTIEGMSWLRDTLKQGRIPYVEAPGKAYFELGGRNFDFRYAPDGCVSHDRRGSLVIAHHWDDDNKSTALRYNVLVRRAGADGDFVLWGAANECILEEYPEEYGIQIFGPDVQPVSQRGRPSGIFGLNHEALLSSEWIHKDALTVKFELEIRTSIEPEILQEDRCDIPPNSFSESLLSLLDDGRCSDVTFIVQGQRIKSHSQILSAHSEYFYKAFTSGLRESISKEVVVEDCDVVSFKAFLTFLYSGDFSHIEAMIEKATSAEESTSEADAESSILLNILGLSHKYQIARLQSWCEHTLCAHLSVNSVCFVLRQAHLWEAKQLEKKCYEVIKSNLPAVMGTPAYLKVFKDWPEVALKIHLFTSGLPESTMASLLDTQMKTKQEAGSKRKREE